MLFWVLFSLLALAAAALVVFAARRRKITRKSGSQTPKRARVIAPSTSRTVHRREIVATGEPYEAVSVVPGLEACPAARELRNHRFLIGEAPTLPLADCTSTNCTCRLRQFTDRRHESEFGDRRRDVGLKTNIHPVEDRPGRRSGKGRRKADS
ncbi:MAG: hypothetical protein ABR578_13590 [Chromatocurvus sp.]